MKRVVDELHKMKAGTRAYAVFVLCAATAAALHAQITLFSFDGADGKEPKAGLVQATNGDFYGTTEGGGANAGNFGQGTVFKITPSGALTTLYSFCSQGGDLCTDGYTPMAGLVQAANGDFYGTTAYGGANQCPSIGTSCGTVFKVTPSGMLTTLHSFAGSPADGDEPFAGLVQGTDGNLYGTTYGGGANAGNFGGGYGTIFKITPSGTLTTLYSFCAQSGCPDGGGPQAGLVQAANGDFYGTTFYGGVDPYNQCPAYGGCGTVFRITPGGVLTTLHSFCAQEGACTDGEEPVAGLVQATNGDLYGTTSSGGAYDAGTVFKITPSGTLTTLYSFCSPGGFPYDCPDGSLPEAGLVQATNGDLYGTTSYDGANGAYGGTIFRITPSGALTTLYSFCAQSACTDGENPAALIQATSGAFYGTTNIGGANNDGTFFRLSQGLGPFVETQTTSGKVGAAVKILGTDLTGATSVTFNGTAAVFAVVSSSEITTTVPTGATTGKVEVATPNGTLSSNVAFRVP